MRRDPNRRKCADLREQIGIFDLLIKTARTFFQRIVRAQNRADLLDDRAIGRRHEQRAKRGVIAMQLIQELRIAARPPEVWKENLLFDADVPQETAAKLAVADGIRRRVREERIEALVIALQKIAKLASQ